MEKFYVYYDFELDTLKLWPKNRLNQFVYYRTNFNRITIIGEL